MMNVLYKSIFTPLGVFNRSIVKGRLSASIVTVIATALLGSIIAPIAVYYANRSKYRIELDVSSMAIELAVSILTWLIVCIVFLVLSKAFHKDIGLSQIASTWGLSYIPNFLCILLYRLLQINPAINNGSGIAAFILGTFFILFLVWKAIFFFMLLKLVIQTNLSELILITTVSAVVFLILMVIGFKVGIQVPMI